MQIIIMCGGVYDIFNAPKQLSVINGERLIDRTIRLLKENGATDIKISATDKVFKELGVPVLEHENSYTYINGVLSGYWLDAYYPSDEPTIYLHGDVYFSEDAIKTILNYKTDKNTLIGNKMALNEEHKNYGEPFGYIVVDQKEFRKGIEDVKRLQDEGKTERLALCWELYRYLNNLDINVQNIVSDTYLMIDDETIDIDSPEQIETLNKKLGG